MKKSRFTDSQIMAALKRVEAGLPVPEICRELGISSATFYKWRAKFGGMDTSMMARMKELEDENRRLKKMYLEEKLKAEIADEYLANGWRQLPWPVNDNYVGRLEAYTGRVREAGLPLDLRTQIEGSKHARQENHGPPSAQVQTTPQQAQPSSFCRQSRHQ